MNNSKVQELMAMSQGEEGDEGKENSRKGVKGGGRKQLIGPWSSSKQKEAKEQQLTANKSKDKRISTMNPVIRSKDKKNLSEMNRNQQ